MKPHFLKALPAYILNLILLILSTQVVDFVAYDNIHVVVFLTPLFYWTIFQPSLLPLWFVFLSGLLIDFTVDSALGLHSFLFVVYYMILYRVRRIVMSQPFVYHLVIFMMSAVFFEMARWLLISLLTWQFSELLMSVLAIILNIVAFFPILLVLRFVQRIVSGNGKSQSL